MRITILTLGSRGDVQPYVALGLGLKNAGYDVCLATFESFQPFVEATGLKFFPMRGNPEEELKTEEARKWLDSDGNPAEFMRHFIALTKKRMETAFEDAWHAAQDCDTIIYSTLGIAGYHVAEKLRIPSMMSNLQPFSATKEFPTVGDPFSFSLGSLYNLNSHFWTDQLFWQPFRKDVNRWRKEVLDLPPVPFWGAYKQLKQDRIPILYGYSPSVIPKPKDWQDFYHVTGYWFLDADEEWQPPQTLVDFLEAGAPPVYIGFGSMSDKDAEGLSQMVSDAVAQVGCRAIISAGWADLRPYSSDNIYLAGSVPHSWLFPQMAAVVHHGGAGTTAAGFRAGVPSLIVPYFADQHFWAKKVEELGVGPASVRRSQLTVDKLAEAIKIALSDQNIQTNARRLGEKIRAEDGVETAVNVVRHYLATK